MSHDSAKRTGNFCYCLKIKAKIKSSFHVRMSNKFPPEKINNVCVSALNYANILLKFIQVLRELVIPATVHSSMMQAVDIVKRSNELIVCLESDSQNYRLSDCFNCTVPTARSLYTWISYHELSKMDRNRIHEGIVIHVWGYYMSYYYVSEGKIWLLGCSGM